MALDLFSVDLRSFSTARGSWTHCSRVKYLSLGGRAIRVLHVFLDSLDNACCVSTMLQRLLLMNFQTYQSTAYVFALRVAPRSGQRFWKRFGRFIR